MSDLISIPEPLRGKTVKSWFEHESVRDTLLSSLGGVDSTYQQYIANVAMLVADTPELQVCSKGSIITAAVQSANLNLMVNKALGHAWLVPYYNKNKKCKEAQLQIGYKGYVYKFEENGYSIDCEVVTIEEEEQGCFAEVRGSNPKITFSPMRSVRRTEENISLVYACAMKPGRKPILAVMTKEEVFEVASKVDREGIRKLGRTWQSKDRYTDYAEMCKKTAIRRLAKSVPIKSINELSYWEAERDNNMIDHQPIKDVSPPASNMTALTSEKEEEPEEEITVPSEFPLRIDDEMTDMFTSVEEAAGFLREEICKRSTKEERMALIEENQQLTRYLIASKKADTITALHALTEVTDEK